MTRYSNSERLIASLLKRFPAVKRVLKSWYEGVNALLYKKKYRYKVLGDRDIELEMVPVGESDTEGCVESFFGYYDKCPENSKHDVVCHRTNYGTHNKPSASEPVELVLVDGQGEVSVLDATRSYNWQQGARVQWVDDNSIMYNVYDELDRQYKAVMLDVNTKNRVVYEYPVQAMYGDEYFLAINYRRLWTVRPDYCYRNIPEMTAAELADLRNDGIWMVNQSSGESEMVHSLDSIMRTDQVSFGSKQLHCVNHVMCSPNGKKFIFIHRIFEGGVRKDRLLISDFSSLQVLINESMVSHCCWVDDDTIFGYFSYEGKPGFYFYDIEKGDCTLCETINKLGTGDGHPSVFGKYIVFDTYPDKSRMQTLLLYDMVADVVHPLVEVYHGLNYRVENRCDLHPRFSRDGKRIYFDTVCNGYRQLCRINIEGYYEE